MKEPYITKISVYPIELLLKEPYRLSGGRLVDTKVDSTIVAVETNDGIIGWGEGCPWGARYLPAFSGGLRAGLDEVAPALLGQHPLQLDKVNQLMDATLSGHWYVKSAIDMACWDLLGKYAKQPLYVLLGGHFGTHIMVHISIIKVQFIPEHRMKWWQASVQLERKDILIFLLK